MPEWLKREWQRRGLATVVLGVALILTNLLLSAFSSQIKALLDTYTITGASNIFQSLLQTNVLIVFAFLCLIWSGIKYGFSEIRDKSLMPQITGAETKISEKIADGFSEIARELSSAITNTSPEIIDTTTLLILQNRITKRETLEQAAVIVNRRLYGGDSLHALDYATYLQSDLINLVKEAYPFFRTDFSISGTISENHRANDERITYETVYKYELHPANGQSATGSLPVKVWIDAEQHQLKEALDALELEVSITVGGTSPKKIIFDDEARKMALEQLDQSRAVADVEPFKIVYEKRQLILYMTSSISIGKIGAIVNISSRGLINREDRFQTVTTSMPTRNADFRFAIGNGLPNWEFSMLNLSSMSMPIRSAGPNRFECVRHDPRFIWYKVYDWLMPGIVATAEWNFPREGGFTKVRTDSKLPVDVQ
jgi:hypothetical protein